MPFCLPLTRDRHAYSIHWLLLENLLPFKTAKLSKTRERLYLLLIHHAWREMPSSYPWKGIGWYPSPKERGWLLLCFMWHVTQVSRATAANLFLLFFFFFFLWAECPLQPVLDLSSKKPHHTVSSKTIFFLQSYLFLLLKWFFFFKCDSL